MKKLICITGIDGAGKSTILSGIADDPLYYLADIWQPLGNSKGPFFQSKKAVDDFLCTLSADSRLLFLSHALRTSLDAAYASEKDTIIFNGYYFKYFASELALGASEELVYCIIRSFPIPDITIQILLKPEIAAERKKNYTRYECGLSSEPGKRSFIEFQNTLLACYDKFQIHNHIKLDGEKSSAILIEEVRKLLK